MYVDLKFEGSIKELVNSRCFFLYMQSSLVFEFDFACLICNIPVF
jgi:hypothetical protein